MKIGVLSDSHDNLPKIKKAVGFFNKKKVNLVLHAGDFVAPFTIPHLKNLICDWRGVFGNNDGEKKGLYNISEGKIKKPPFRIQCAKKRITLIHDINQIDTQKENAHLIIFGHTHKPKIINKDGKVLVNPGECGAWLTGKSTVALVDLASFSIQIFKI